MNDKLQVAQPRNKKSILLILLAIILILIAGFRPIGFDRDSTGYVQLVEMFSDFTVLHFLIAEPSFWLVEAINNMILNDEVRNVFIIYAILGVSLKFGAIKRISTYPIVSIIAYVCIYFPLHEMTQIRVGVASAIFLFAIPDLFNNNFKGYFTKILFASLFHLSSLFLLPFYFLNSKSINRYYYGFLPAIAILFSLNSKLLFSIFRVAINYLPNFLNAKLNRYIEIMEVSDMHSDISLFDVYHLTLIMIYYVMLMIDRSLSSKYDILVIKFLGWSLVIFYTFSFIPVVATRLSEYIGIVIIFAITIPISFFKQKLPIYGLILAYLFLILSTYLFIKDDFFDFSLLHLYFRG